MQERENAWFNTEPVCVIDRELVEEVRRRAAASSRGVFRFCLHRSTSDGVQEMLIAVRQDAYFPPHRHPDRSTTFVILEGRLRLLVFDAQSRVLKRIDLVDNAQSGAAFATRLCAGQWHMTVSLSPQCLFYETIQGPEYREDATWAPAADAEPAEIERFLRRVSRDG